MGRDALSAVILAKAGIQRVTHAKRHFLPSPRVGEGQGEGMVALATKSGLGPTADLLYGIAQKVGKKASPCTPLLPPVLAEHANAGGMRIATIDAMRPSRCADDAGFYFVATARCSAPRRGLKGRLEVKQLYAQSSVGWAPRARCQVANPP